MLLVLLGMMRLAHLPWNLCHALLLFHLFIFVTYPLNIVFFPGKKSMQMLSHYTKLTIFFI